jgi:carboxylate-amine ligase
MAPQPAVFTFGVEEEYQIIDPTTRNLCSNAEFVLTEAQKLLGSTAQPEIHLAQIEVATPVCSTLVELREKLCQLRKGIITAAARYNKHIAAAGSHPFSHWSAQVITPRARYQALERDYQQLAREQSIFGCHVHVGIESHAMALQVINRARIWLSCLLALTSNSPFWWGTDTGYMSYRHLIWARWPQAGPPPGFASLNEYEALMQALVTTRSIEDRTKLYWDMRISERFPTVEVRIMDVCTTIDEAVMIAGIVRALVRTCYEQVKRGEPAIPAQQELLRISHWHAARYGLEANLIDVRSERAIPALQLIEDFLDFLRPALERQGDWHEITMLVNKVIQQGIGASRQRNVYKQTGRLEDVVDFIVAETAKGTT